MHYTMRGGVQRSWRHRATGLLRHIRNHNWLPMAAATIITAWLALIISGFSQTPPSVATPQTQSSNTADSIAVDYKTDTPNDLTVTPPSSTHSNQTNVRSKPVSAKSQDTTTTPIATSPPPSSNEIGGRGADTSTQAPSTTTSSTSTSTNDATNSNGSLLNIDLGLGSLLDVSAGVGGDSLLQADIGLGL